MAIGETVLGAVLQVVIDKLATEVVIKFFRRCKFDQSLVNKLKLLMLAAATLLLDAEQKRMTNDAVNEWLDELKHWFYRAEQVIDEISTRALRASLKSRSKVLKFVPETYISFKFNTKIGEEIKEIVNMLESMLAQKDVLGLKEIRDEEVHLTAERTTSSVMEDSKVYGRDHEKEKLLKLILSSEVPERNNYGVVVIWGMGGIGKTTLAKMVYNDASVQGAFVLKAWVCVSDPFDIYKITKSILESLTKAECSSSSSLEFVQDKLKSEIGNKKFIFVLDDVWNKNYDQWQDLQAPFSGGANGSKIIVTTRDEEVANTMRTMLPLTVDFLSDDDAWSVFSRHAFELGNVMFDPCLETIGKKIVKRCKGLPLAIKAVGGLLRSKNDSKEWETILGSSLWDLPQTSKGIPALWLSYYHLPGHLKRCFSYCALFPKDYKIDRKQLVRLWMAEDMLQSTDVEIKVEEAGEKYLRQLVAKSFLEPGDKSYVTMHDLMHDLAQGVSGNFLAGQGIKKLGKNSERVRGFSYVPEYVDTYSKFQSIDGLKHLRTFLLLQPWWSIRGYFTFAELSTILKPSLSCLRVLSLSRCRHLDRLELIECPKQLRYLDMSGTNITLLPGWLSTLCNLQTLILSDCKNLEKLPADMWRLVSLRHLDIRGATKLTHMPEQMSKLTSLRTLSDFIVGESIGSDLQELRELRYICGKLTIGGLQNVKVPRDAYVVNLSSRIEELVLRFTLLENGDFNKHKEVLERLEPSSDLQRLVVESYMGLKFPRWLDPGCTIFKNLASLCLLGCLHCITLPPLGQLASLKYLEIKGMESIKEVGHEFYGHGMCDPFPSLESLSFKNMKGWEVWSHVDAEGCAVCLACLTDLKLNDCPNLKGNLSLHAPSLVNLDINKCGKLSRLLPQLASIHELEMTTPRLERLVIKDCEALECLPEHMEFLMHLKKIELINCPNLKGNLPVHAPSLVNLDIERCGKLSGLLPQLASIHALEMATPRLERLVIKECSALECLPERMEFLMHLKEIILRRCPCLRWAPGNSLPTCLKSISIIFCESFEFPIPMDMMKHYTSLESLYLDNVGNHLAYFPLGSFTSLRSLVLHNCVGLEKVYIPEGIDDNNLMSLSVLKIHGCPELEMIGKERGESGEATLLPTPNLKRLEISDCEKLRALLMIGREGEVLLPKLRRLTIPELNSLKMTSESGLSLRENLFKFSCLKDLHVWGDEEVECFGDPNQGWGSLPTSLISLTLKECPKLSKLDGKALGNLIHLQSLYISDCPKLERLPEEGLPPSLYQLTISDCPKLERLPEDGLPPSLGYLTIRGCPKLEERCNRPKGKDFSKICHTTQVDIGN